MKKYRILLLMVMMAALTSCDDLANGNIGHILSNDGMAITSMTFSPEYDTITVMADVSRDLDKYEHNDTNHLKVKVYDLYKNLIPLVGPGRIRYVDLKRIGVEELKKSGITMTVLVDLTEPSRLIQKQQEIVERISHDYAEDNLFIAFMLPHGRVTHIFKATPYIINNYITADSRLLNIQHSITPSDSVVEVNDSVSSRAYLYRSINTTIERMQDPADSTLASSTFKSLLVLSDGVVYNEILNTPIDPGHYEIQNKLIEQSRKMSDDMCVNFANLATPGTDVDESTIDNTFIRTICMESGGEYYDSFVWEKVREGDMQYFNINIDEYILRFAINHGRPFFGETHYLKVNFTTAGDSVLASAYKEFRLGSIYHPLTVGPRSFFNILLLRGLVILLILALLAYIVLQLIYPFVRKRIFYRKNEVTYTGPSMSVNSVAVPTQCYYCKMPFDVGDRIIVACEHVMHKSCWHENGNHCPEYGTHCKTGGHRYNSDNILDPRNAHYIHKWIQYAILAIALSWYLTLQFHMGFLADILNYAVSYVQSNSETVSVDALDSALGPDLVTARLYHAPKMFLLLSFFMTFILSWQTSTKTVWWNHLSNLLVRATVASLITVTAFVLEFITLLFLDMYDGLFILDWMPVAVSAFATALCISYNSRVRVRLRRYQIGAVIIGLICSFIMLYMLMYDSISSLLSLLLVFIIFAAGILCLVAQHLPYHDHYTLHVSGAIKDMDIALYKWLRQAPDATVTIGRSVDCSLQLSWDIQSDLAPVHVAITQRKGRPQMVALEENVIYNGKPMKINIPRRMYHGDTFQIGKTTFAYIDR